MDSGLIGKIEKAKRYAEERDRVQFSSFEANIKTDCAIIIFDICSKLINKY